ncbi:MAG: hypothetical protein R3F59_02305 [Myxococcota bacterium]
MIALMTALLSAPAHAGDVGLRVMVQPWTPVTDDDHVERLVDDPALISGAIHGAWVEHQAQLHDALVTLLGQGDLVMDGVTMQDIDLRVPEPTLTLTSRGGGGAAPLDLAWVVTFDGIHLATTLTTPSDLGAWADPRAMVDFDLTFTVPVGPGADVARPLSVSTIPPGTELVAVSDVHVDSDNVVADIALAVARVFVDPDRLLERKATRALQDVNDLGLTMVRQGVTAVNDGVAGVVPSGLVRISSWVRPTGLLTFAFGVVGPLPDGPSASITGTFRSATTDGGVLAAARCEQMPIRAARKAGPRAILNDEGLLGEAPMQPLNLTVSCTGSTYRISGLSALFPNELTTGAYAGCTTADPSSLASVYRVTGLPSRLLAADLARTWDVTGETYTRPCGAFTLELATLKMMRVDPVINPWATPVDQIRRGPAQQAPTSPVLGSPVFGGGVLRR